MLIHVTLDVAVRYIRATSNCYPISNHEVGMSADWHITIPDSLGCKYMHDVKLWTNGAGWYSNYMPAYKYDGYNKSMIR